ncbi:hypothetical protein AURDEDRAFT_168651 [Auricularia subglabra TFB-10046 SS5]|nr:hypothetical protein AURDEDRAFT_168651 [Auricularia subglabra TFB-10046 SS5]
MSDSRRILGRFEARSSAVALSVVTTILAGAVGAVSWFEFATLPPSRVANYGIISTGVVFSFIALFAFSGLFFSLTGTARSLKKYARELTYLPVPAIPSTVFLMMFLFSDGDHGFLEACLDDLRTIADPQSAYLPPQGTDGCYRRLAVMKGIFIPLLAVTILTLTMHASFGNMQGT